MIFAAHASTGSGPQSTSPTVFTLIVNQPETHIFWYMQFFSGSRLLGCVYIIIFFLKDAMSYKMWRLHVIIIQPASGRLQGYVLKFPCFPTISWQYLAIWVLFRMQSPQSSPAISLSTPSWGSRSSTWRAHCTAFHLRKKKVLSRRYTETYRLSCTELSWFLTWISCDIIIHLLMDRVNRLILADDLGAKRERIVTCSVWTAVFRSSRRLKWRSLRRTPRTSSSHLVKSGQNTRFDA